MTQRNQSITDYFDDNQDVVQAVAPKVAQYQRAGGLGVTGTDTRAMASSKINEPDVVAYDRDGAIPLKDDLIMGPLDKYKKYGVFPWKMLIHTLLIVMVTAECLLVVQPEAEFAGSISDQLNQLFLTTDPDGYDPPEIGSRVMLFNIPEVTDYVNRTVTNYFDIKSDEILNEFYPAYDSSGEIVPVDMFIFLLKNNYETAQDIPKLRFSLTPDDLGPFELDQDNLWEFLNEIDYLSLNFDVFTGNDANGSGTTGGCYQFSMS